MPASRRATVTAFDACFALAACALVWLVLATPALAYVDPSVMTYTIQALAGVAVALSAVLGVVWRRARRALLRALHVDENTGKCVEAEARACSDQASLTSADERARAMLSARIEHPAPTLSWRARLVLALIVSLSLAYCLFFVSPLEVVIPGFQSLSFTLANVWLPLIALVVLTGAALALATSLTRGRAFDVVLAIVAAICLCALLQELALNTSLPAADGSPVDWAAYHRGTMVSSVAWIVILAAAALLAWKRPLASRVTAVACCLVIVIAQSVALCALGFQNAEALTRPTVTKEGLTTVSTKSNVVVFVLDMFDTKDMDDVMEQYPDTADGLGGFTWYRNSLGSVIPTRYGVPFIVTGHDFDPSLDEFTTADLESWFSDRNLLDVAAEQGYSVGVYSDSVSYGANALASKTMNVHTVEPYVANFLSCAKALGGCGLYRDLPYALKPFLWFTTDQLNEAIAPTDTDSADKTPYVFDDKGMHALFSEPCLTATDDSAGGAYRVIHCQGTHWPYTMDENGNTVTTTQNHASMIAQGRGSLGIVEEYIQQLKELGVYDQTTIVITADHGVWPWGNEELTKTTSPILLVKPAGADASQPLAISEVPTGHIDLPATLEWAVGAWNGTDTDGACGSSSVLADSTPVSMVTDGPRPRYFFWNNHDGKHDLNFLEYEVNGDANDFSDWRLTGRRWNVDVDGYN